VLPPELPGFEFITSGDEIIITKYVGDKSVTEIVIPDSAATPDKSMTFRVTGIEGLGGWRHCFPDSMKKVIFSDTITRIGDYAFEGCTSLNDVTIPQGVTSIGYRAFFGCTSLTGITIPESVTSIGNLAFDSCTSLTGITIPESVTSIGDSAFMGCTSLTGITIPESVTRIGDHAFDHCTSLTGITIPESVTRIGDSAFSYCTSLTGITIPRNVTRIGEYTFSGCTLLTGITIPQSVTSIGNFAFEDCISLTGITIPDSVTRIGEKAFEGCKSLTRVTLPKGISYGNAFYKCRLLKEKNMLEGVEPVSSSAVDGTPLNKTDRRLEPEKAPLPEQLEIPDCRDNPCALLCCTGEDLHHIRTLLIELYWEGFNIRYDETPSQQTLDDSQCILAFFTEQTAHSITAMETLECACQRDTSRIIQVFLGDCSELPDAIRHNLQAQQAIVQKNSTPLAFSGGIRAALRTFGCGINHPRGFEVRNTGNAVEIVKFRPAGFSQIIIPKTFFNPPLSVTRIGDSVFSGCTSLTGITIPESVTSIGGHAFDGCTSLTGITIPESVTSIGNSAFDGCKSLTGITIPQGVTRIGKYAFFGCTSLTGITIPQGVTSIGYRAFFGCTSLTGITIPESVASIVRGVFLGCTSLTCITIPESVTSIGESAFSGCTSLTCITIPESVTSIGKEAFCGCTSLTDVTIPQGVTSISEDAFKGCDNLTIYCRRYSKAWWYAVINRIKHKKLSKFASGSASVPEPARARPRWFDWFRRRK
jgi:hypothetical protein